MRLDRFVTLALSERMTALLRFAHGVKNPHAPRNKNGSFDIVDGDEATVVSRT